MNALKKFRNLEGKEIIQILSAYYFDLISISEDLIEQSQSGSLGDNN